MKQDRPQIQGWDLGVPAEICADFPALAHPAASGASSPLAPHLPTVLRFVHSRSRARLLSLHVSGSWMCPQLQRAVPRLSPNRAPKRLLNPGTRSELGQEGGPAGRDAACTERAPTHGAGAALTCRNPVSSGIRGRREGG